MVRIEGTTPKLPISSEKSPYSWKTFDLSCILILTRSDEEIIKIKKLGIKRNNQISMKHNVHAGITLKNVSTEICRNPASGYFFQ